MRVREAYRSTAGSLGGIQEVIRSPYECLRRVISVCGERNPNAGADLDLGTANVDGLLDRIDDGLCDLFGFEWIGETDQYNDKLVTAWPRDQIATASVLLQDSRYTT